MAKTIESKFKKIKIILIIESIIIAVVALIIAMTFIFDDNAEHLLTRSKSPNGTSVATIYEVGRPFIFGPSRVRVYCSDTVFETTISNDGAALSDSNYDVKWDGNVPVITFHGEEQNDVTYRVTSKAKEVE